MHKGNFKQNLKLISLMEKRNQIFMGKNKQKVTFEVQENEKIEECLERMKKQGYTPIRRIEKPIFKEVVNDGKTGYEPVGRQIIFEARAIE